MSQCDSMSMCKLKFFFFCFSLFICPINIFVLGSYGPAHNLDNLCESNEVNDWMMNHRREL